MNVRGKEVDTTYLSLDQAESRGFLHRDYLAHCLRWSHVVKWLQEKRHYEDALILDVGCGKEAPLMKMIYSMKMTCRAYVGVDAGPITPSLRTMPKFQHFLLENSDFAKIGRDRMPPWEDEELFNVGVCFEVLEHMEPTHMILVLRKIKSLLKQDAHLFISTPNWDMVNCAGNHVNEIKYLALGSVLEREGFTIESTHGTFASLKDYEHLMPPEWLKLHQQLRAYYDTNFLSCIWAPLFPAQSRNCLWHLRNKQPKTRMLPPLSEVEVPWSSSEKWGELDGLEADRVPAL